MKTLVASIGLCLALAGCNTMAGIGQDMQQGGRNLTHSAREAQQPNPPPPPPAYASGEAPAYPPPPASYPPPPPPQPYR